MSQTTWLPTLLLIISLTVYTVKSGSKAKRVIVRPTDSNSSICHGPRRYDNCDTLSNLISNKGSIFKDNRASTFYFLPGIHKLHVDTRLSLVHVQLPNYLNWYGNKEEETVIICENPLVFAFYKIRSLAIKSLQFLKCGQTLWKFKVLHDNSLVRKVSATLLLLECTSFNIQNVNVSQSKGYGIFGMNLQGENHIKSSYFLVNSIKAGGAAFYFNDRLYPAEERKNAFLSIMNSFFHGTDLSGEKKSTCFQGKSHTLFKANGLAIIAEQMSYQVEALVADTKFSQNTGNGALPAVWIHDSGGVANKNTFNFTRCRFEKEGTVRISSGKSKKCGKTKSICDSPSKENRGDFSIPVISMNNCNFTDSYHTALEICVKPTGYTYNLDRVQQISIIGCTFQHHHNNLDSSVVSIHYSTDKNPHNYFTIRIAQSHFISNTVPALAAQLELQKYSGKHYRKVIILSLEENCFFHNSDLKSAVVQIRALPNDLIPLWKYKEPAFRDDEVIGRVDISRCKFKNNTLAKNQGILLVENVYVLLDNSTFESSQGTALYALRSVVHIEGFNSFTGNKGTFGGALNLNMSRIFVTSNSHTLITNNSALYGGGVFALANLTTFNKEHGYTYNRCTISQEERDTSNRIDFVGNKAKHTGHLIFGGIYKNCRFVCTKNKVWKTSFSHFFETLVGISANVNSIVSPPSKLCICQNGHKVANQCKTSTSLTVFPGETFTVPVFATNELNRIMKAVVVGRVCKSYSEKDCTRDYKNDIGHGQRTQELNTECTNVTYSVNGKSDVSIEVKIDYYETSNTFEDVEFLTIKNFLGYKKGRVTIRVEPSECPVGLKYEGTDKYGVPLACKCLSYFSNQGVSCNVKDGTVTKPPKKWIYSGIGMVEKAIPLLANRTVVHKSCPYDYCVNDEVSVNLSEPDQQCNFNRSEILCGACKTDLSVVLGTSNCMECSNVYLLLIIPFALAGVALVVLLLKCNLTVSVGHINGIIFYANIVQVNKALLFPNQSTAYKIFSTFIAWLNLDLGIETCFFENMDSYGKVWLQFVFPVYLWVMIGLIVLLANYSTKLGRMIGSNSVPVLATLFLLSYAKLLRTIIAAVSFTFIEFEDDPYLTVWLKDGNVEYFNSKHAALFLAAFTFATFYILPLTLLVLLAPCLQARSHHKAFKWVNRLKPFLDAYQGPYTDKFRYWTGLLLILRVLLFIMDASNYENDSSMSFFWTTTILCPFAMLCLIKGNVYRHKLANHLETLSLFNIVILCSVNWLTTTTDYGKWHVIREYATYISVAVMMAKFIVIVCYQACGKIVPKPKRKVKNNEETEVFGETRVREKTQATFSVVELEPLKEPLLDTE